MSTPGGSDEQSELSPELLVAHAQFLADLAGDKTIGRIHLRRSVSAASYAVFHCVTTQVVRSVAPTASDVDRYSLCRAFEHGDVEKIAKWVKGDGSAPASSMWFVESATSAVLRRYADHLVQLKVWRHRADYDHLWTIGRSTASSARLAATQAIDALDAARHEPGWTSFCTVMLMHGTGRTR